jgi:hypothetical protein
MRGCPWCLRLKEQRLKVCINSAPVPVGAPLRESSPDRAYGTPLATTLSDLGRPRTRFGVRDSGELPPRVMAV